MGGGGARAGTSPRGPIRAGPAEAGLPQGDPATLWASESSSADGDTGLSPASHSKGGEPELRARSNALDTHRTPQLGGRTGERGRGPPPWSHLSYGSAFGSVGCIWFVTVLTPSEILHMFLECELSSTTPQPPRVSLHSPRHPGGRWGWGEAQQECTSWTGAGVAGPGESIRFHWPRFCRKTASRDGPRRSSSEVLESYQSSSQVFSQKQDLLALI